MKVLIMFFRGYIPSQFPRSYCDCDGQIVKKKYISDQLPSYLYQLSPFQLLILVNNPYNGPNIG